MLLQLVNYTVTVHVWLHYQLYCTKHRNDSFAATASSWCTTRDDEEKGKQRGYEAYEAYFKQRGLKFENETEFVALCDMLDASGIIAIKSRKEIRQNTIPE